VKVITKYDLSDTENPCRTPEGRVCMVAPDPQGRPSIWIEHEKDAPATVEYGWLMTGEPYEEKDGVYAGSLIYGQLVMHVFRVGVPDKSCGGYWIEATS
jgi:hypothetical protein